MKNAMTYQSAKSVSQGFGLLVRSTALPLLAVAGMAGKAYALPQDGQVASGRANINQSSAVKLDVHQQSQKVSINWRSFDTSAQETVQFYQPGADAIALNRVTNGQVTNFQGTLKANGNVWLINQSGVVFGAGSKVDVGGLVASTANISDADFQAGRYVFSQPGQRGAKVVNRGEISVRDGGLAALVAPGVENHGVIQANFGKVALASGETFALDLYGDNLIHFAVPDSKAGTVEHHGRIEANGGKVQITANEASDVVAQSVNVTGVVQANRIRNVGGEVVIDAGNGGDAWLSGTVDVKGVEGKGGKAKVLGTQVTLTSTAKVDASGAHGGGDILVGGNKQGKGAERNAANSYVASGATLVADALVQGDGGKVIVWADGSTGYHGSISARGAGVGGNGGFAEVSGKQALWFDGSADLSAPQGNLGMLLLDPLNFSINAGWGLPTFNSIGANMLEMLLLATNVTVQTANFGPQDGDIFVNSSVNWSSAGSLTLSAHRDIVLKSRLIANYVDAGGDHSKGAVTLEAGRHITGGESSPVSNNRGIQTQSGAISLTAGLTDASGDIALNGINSKNMNIRSVSGDISFSAADDIALVNATDGNNGNWTRVRSDNGSVSLTTGGDITATGGGNNNSFVEISSGGADVTLNAGGTVHLADGLGATDAELRLSAVTGYGITAGEHVTLQADLDVTGVGAAFDVLAGDYAQIDGDVTTNGGAISVSADTDHDYFGQTLIRGTLSSAGGAVSLEGPRVALEFGGNVQAGSGNVTVNDGFFADTGFLTADANSITTTGQVEIHQNVPGFGLIQNALDAVASGYSSFMLWLGSGVFEEQVTIAKNVTIEGKGQGVTTIKAPTVLANNVVMFGTGRTAVVGVTGAHVNLSKLTVDGDGQGAAAPGMFMGIGYANASGTIDDVEVKAVRHAPANGVQGGNGIYIANDDAVSRTVTVENSYVHDFQKNGITGNGEGLDAQFLNNTVVGSGAVNYIAQNGIQLGFGAGGRVEGNSISGIGYTLPGWLASGILLYDVADGTEVIGNSITGTGYDAGIYAQGNQLVIQGNVVDGSAYGLISAGNQHVIGGATALEGNQFTNNGTGIWLVDGANHLVQSNSVNQNDVGVYVDGSDAATIANNEIKNNSSTGLLVENSGVGVVNSIAVTGNSFNGTPQYISNRVGTLTIDASSNSFNGKTPALMSWLERTQLEDNIEHIMDNGSYGRVVVTSGVWYATVNNLGIQQAIDVAASGETVQAGAGVFEETLDIGKAVTVRGLRGAGGALLTTIRTPGVLSASHLADFDGFSQNYAAVIYVHDTDGVNLRDFVLDGAGSSYSQPSWVGIAFDNAGGEARNLTIQNMGSIGTGVFAIANGSDALRTVTVAQSRIDSRYGVFGYGDKLTAQVLNNQFTVQDGFSSYGVWMWDGVAGRVQGNSLAYAGSAVSTGSALIRVEDAADEFLIQSNTLTVDSDQTGIHVKGTEDARVLSNTITGGYRGIHIDGSDGAQVKFNRITDATTAIRVNPSVGVVVMDDTIVGGVTGVELVSSDDALVSSNSISGVSGNAVDVLTSANVEVYNNSISDVGGDAVHAANAANLLVNLNTISDVAGDGVDVASSDGVWVRSNSLTGVVGDGVVMTGSNNALIRDNILTDITGDGVDVSSASAVEILMNQIDVAANGVVATLVDGLEVADNLIDDVVQSGIKLVDSLAANIFRNSVDGAGSHGVEVANSGVVISTNDLRNITGHGISVSGSNAADIRFNTVTLIGQDGIHLENSNLAYIFQNGVTYTGDEGIEVVGSGDATVYDNWVARTGGNGIELVNAGSATVDLNEVLLTAGNGIYLNGSDDALVQYNLVTDSGLNGIYVYDSERATIQHNTVDGTGVGAVNPFHLDGISVVFGADHVIDQNTVIDSAWDGINLWATDGAEVSANTVTNAYRSGITVGGGVDALIRDNILNANWGGMWIVGGTNTRIVDNSINGTTTHHGIYVDGGETNLSILGNTVDNAALAGIYVRNSQGVTIGGAGLGEGNSITGAATDGIYVSGLTGTNLIDHNTIQMTDVGDDDGVQVHASSGNVTVSYNQVTGAGNNGVEVSEALLNNHR